MLAVLERRALGTTRRVLVRSFTSGPGEGGGADFEPSSSTCSSAPAASSSSSALDSGSASASTSYSSSASTTVPGSTGSAGSAEGSTRNQDLIDQLWDRVLRTPTAVTMHSSPQTRSTRSPMSNATPAPRRLKGTQGRSHRAAGQTPAEAGRMNDSLRAILHHLEERALTPAQLAARRGAWDAMVSAPRGGVVGRGGSNFASSEAATAAFASAFGSGPGGLRVEDESPELAEAIDKMAEQLSMLSSPGEVVEWAERNVFVREGRGRPADMREGEVRGEGEGGESAEAAGVNSAPSESTLSTRSSSSTPFPTPDEPLLWPKTYPRALAATMRSLRRLNAPHLALAVFDHARSLGATSYLAGCQTSAYNELLRVLWDAFADLRGVADAVREMEAHAVAWDRQTAEIVGGVAEQVARDVLQKQAHYDDAHALLAVLERGVQQDTSREEGRFERRRETKRVGRRFGIL